MDNAETDTRCAMTDEQYNKVTLELEYARDMVELTKDYFGDDASPVQTGLRMIRERIEAVELLMQQAWDETTKTRHAPHA